MFRLVCRPPHCGGSHRKNTRVALQSKQKVNCVANTKVHKKNMMKHKTVDRTHSAGYFTYSV